MRLLLILASVLVGGMALVLVASRTLTLSTCWCWTGSRHVLAQRKPIADGSEYVSYGSYDTEADWDNPQRILSLDYEQAQGKRIFYEKCVWCHADATPAGPSNRSNVSPAPPLMNDGAVLNAVSDDSLRRTIALGGIGVGKSAMMPPYGMSLTAGEIGSLVAYMRVIAVPEYHQQKRTSHWPWRSETK